MRRERVTGLTLSVNRRGGVHYFGSFGEKAFRSGQPADSDTIYSIASLTKQFTAVLLWQLIQESRLSAGDAIARYFPSFGFPPEVEVRHLVSHTSGLVGYTELEDFDLARVRSVAPSEVIQTIAGRPLAFQPGTEWQYSNTNYVLLAMLLEKIADKPYHEILHQRILDRFELERTGCNGIDHVDENAALGMGVFSLGEVEATTPWEPVWTLGTGNLFSTARNMARWNAALMSGEVVPTEQLAEFTRSSILADGSDAHYAWGLGVWDPGGFRELRHTGGLPGFSTANAMYPDLGLDVVVFANTDGLELPKSVVRPILALLTDRPVNAVLPVPAVVAKDALLAKWMQRAQAKALDLIDITPSFARFLTPARRSQLERVLSAVDLEEANLVSRSRRAPTTSYQFETMYESRPILANLSLTDEGGTRFLDFRESNAPELESR
jgi:D-alanyl-D-alanine carboxypeptidase